MELVFRMTVQYDYTESIVGIGMYFGFYRQLIAGSGSSRRAPSLPAIIFEPVFLPAIL
jgi:hypothetical protein